MDNFPLLVPGFNGSGQTYKIEEAETIEVPPPLTEKLLVLGANGFVGSHVCKEAFDRGLTVASLSSGQAQLLPSRDEAEKLRKASFMKTMHFCSFSPCECGHFKVELLTTIFFIRRHGAMKVGSKKIN